MPVLQIKKKTQIFFFLNTEYIEDWFATYTQKYA